MVALGATAVQDDDILASTLSALPDPVILIDGRGTVLLFNRAAADVWPSLAKGWPLSFTLRAPSIVEGVEQFALNLSGLTNAVYAKPAATAAILDNTAVASFSVGNAQVTEPSSGTVNASFTVSLEQALATPVTVAYATADGTAKAGTD